MSNNKDYLCDKFTQLRFVVGWTLEEGGDLLGLICVTVGSFDVPATGVEKGWGIGDSGVRHFVSTAVELSGLSNWIFFLDTGVVGTVVGCDGFLFRIERGVVGVLGAGDWSDLSVCGVEHINEV